MVDEEEEHKKQRKWICAMRWWEKM